MSEYVQMAEKIVMKKREYTQIVNEYDVHQKLYVRIIMAVIQYFLLMYVMTRKSVTIQWR